MLNYEFPPMGGGAANANRYILAEYTGMSDLKIDVLTSAPEPGFYESSFSDNITVYRVGLHKKDLHYWRKSEVIEWLIKAKSCYRKLLKSENYDLAHAFSGFPSGYLCYKTKKQLPYIISLRGSDVPGQNQRLQWEYKLLSPLFRRIWANASEIVACSEGLKQRALRFFPGLLISTIPNGVDLERFQPGLESKPKKPFRLITVGRLSPTKRIELLIGAVKLLRDSGLDVRVKVIGGGALEQQLRRIVLQQGLDSSVELTGRIIADKIPQLYQQSDIYVSATMQEGMSNAMLEAMASGLPIVTTECEGLDELIDDNGIIVKDATAAAIAQSISQIAYDFDFYNKMSNAARKKSEQFSWKQTANLYKQLYRDLLNEKSRRISPLKNKYRIANRFELLLNSRAEDRLQNFSEISEDPESILVSTAAGIGDTIMVAPAIKKLKDRFPQANIYALAHYNRGSNKVFDLMPYIDKTIDLPIANYKWSGVIRFMLGKFWFLLFELRSRKIDLAVFFMPNIIRRFLLAGIGAKNWLYGTRVNDYPGEIAFELLEPLQIEREKPEQVFSVPVPKNSEKILPGVLQRPIIGVHPFCGICWKEWRKFGELLEKLRSIKGTVVVLGKQSGYEALAGVIDLVNETNLSELFWVISRLDLLITADSGPMHIGFALDIPTVALFGFVPPRFLVPESAFKNHKIIYKPVQGVTPPRKVKQRKRLDDAAMQSITVDEVIKASIELLLEQRGIKLEQCVENSR